MKATSLRFLGQSLLIALVAYITLNAAAFLLLYGDTLTPWGLPCYKDFSHLYRLDYRQSGGRWTDQDEELLQTQDDDMDLMAVIPTKMDTSRNYEFRTNLDFQSANLGGGLVSNNEFAPRQALQEVT